jgi:hypothetical protein
VVRDRFETATRAGAHAGDLVLLGLFGLASRSDHHRTGRPDPPRKGAVAACCDPAMLPVQVLHTAARLSRATGEPLALGAPPGLGGQARHLARTHGAQANVLWLPDAEPPAFLHAAARHGAGLCVMASGHARHALRIRAGLHDTLLALAD